jgi:hypothetical protein
MKPFTWSYSALMNYEQCGKKYYHLNVAEKGHPDRVVDADSSFAEDGKIVHEALKARVISDKPLPLPMRHFERLAKPFANAPGDKHGEMKLALTREFEPCDYFAPNVWVRVVIDLAIIRGRVGIVVDWKTGKVKDDFTQMGLNAAVLSRWMPELDLLRTSYVWLQAGKLSPKIYSLEDLTGVWNNLLPRVAKMEQDRARLNLPAKQSKLCGWCPVSQCPHYKARDED